LTRPSSVGIISLYFDEVDDEEVNPDALHIQCLKFVKDSFLEGVLSFMQLIAKRNKMECKTQQNKMTVCTLY